MKNVLITGGAGFIGSHVAEYYANQKNIDVVFIIDNLSRDKLLKKDIKFKRYNWDFLHKYGNIKFFEKDIRDFNFLKDFLKDNDIDIIIHTAGQTAVTTSVIDPITDFENNLIGSFNLLEAIRLSNLKPVVIFCSTNKVFGSNVNDLRVIEKDTRYIFGGENPFGIAEDFNIDLCEHTPYGTSKLCSDLYFQEYGHLYGIKTAVFRMSCIYGPRQFGVEDQGWVAHFVISALTNRKLKIFGDGKQVRDILYINDLIEAYDCFVQRAETIKHDVFCLGGGNDNTLSLLELIEIIKEETGRDLKYEFDKWRPSDQKIYVSNIRKTIKLLNWKPKISPREGVKRIIQWTKSNINLF